MSVCAELATRAMAMKAALVKCQITLQPVYQEVR